MSAASTILRKPSGEPCWSNLKSFVQESLSKMMADFSQYQPGVSLWSICLDWRLRKLYLKWGSIILKRLSTTHGGQLDLFKGGPLQTLPTQIAALVSWCTEWTWCSYLAKACVERTNGTYCPTWTEMGLLFWAADWLYYISHRHIFKANQNCLRAPHSNRPETESYPHPP